MRRVLVLLTLALALVLGTPHLFRWAIQQPGVYVRIALTAAEFGSLKRDEVDWPSLRAEVLERSRGARTAADTHDAIRHLLRGLKDSHSFLVPATVVQDWRFQHTGVLAIRPDNVVFRVLPDSPAWKAGVRDRDLIEAVDGEPPEGRFYVRLPEGETTLRIRSARTGEVSDITVAPGDVDMSVPPVGRLIRGTIGYLELPHAVPDQPAYVSTVRELISDLQRHGATGWVVDLRRNEGGDSQPMLDAARPLLGEGVPGYHLRPESVSAGWLDVALEKASDGMFLRPGARVPWTFSDEPEFQAAGELPPVAVLLSELTGSSAETLAIAFRGLEHARFFGEPTAGLTTSNLTVPLPDGAWMQLTDAVSMDRNGVRFDGPVSPDVLVPIDWAELGTDTDSVLRVAIDWLTTRQRP